MTLPPPISHLGRYDIVRVLGQGAMGVVYEGRDPNLDRRVAIKTVRVVGMPADEILEYEQRFKIEARSAGRLQHPNIVSVYDSNKHEDAMGQTAYIVMEFVEGEDLKHNLDAGKRFSLQQTVSMMSDLLAALHYAHQRNIVHRDIKPANMLLTKEGRIKLTDFGVARITDSGDATKTSAGTVGTLKYMSPEQVAGKGVDASSDLFSAGIVLYQLLTGVRPFDGEGYLDIVSKIVKQDPIAPSRFVNALPPALDAVVAKALAKSKLDRFADAASFSAALNQAIMRADLTLTPSARPRPELADGNGTFPGSLSGSSGSTVTQELELVYWKDIKDSNEAEVLEGFLKRFPVGIYADLAKRKLRAIVQAQGESGAAARYEPTVVHRPPDSQPPSTAISAPLSAQADAWISSTVSPLATAAQSSVGPNASRADSPTLPPSAYNDSEYGVSTQFASTLFPPTEPSALAGKVNPMPANPPATQAAPTQSPASATIQPNKVQEVKRTLAKSMLWSGLGLLFIGIAAFLVMRSPDPTTTATPSETPSLAATDTPSPAASALAAAAQSAVVSGTASSVASPVPTATVAPLPSAAASVPRASLPSLAASAVKALLPAKRSSAAEPQRSAPSAPATQSSPSEPASTPSAPAKSPTESTPPAAAKPAARAVVGPREACEGRILLGYLSCMAEQCERPVFRNHPVCIERREMEERRRSAQPTN